MTDISNIQALVRGRILRSRFFHHKDFNHELDWKDWKERKGKYANLSLCGGFGCHEYMKFNNYIYKNSPHR